MAVTASAHRGRRRQAVSMALGTAISSLCSNRRRLNRVTGAERGWLAHSLLGSGT